MIRCLPILLLCGAVGLLHAQPALSPALLKPVNLDKLNTPKDEDDPFLSADKLRLYYASNADGRFNLFVSERKAANLAWPAGKALEGATGDEETRSPCLTADNHDLFFATKYIVKSPDKELPINFDLVRSIRVAKGQFTAPVPVQAVCTPADELHPWLAADGKELYFSRNTKEGWRVFVSTRKDTKTAFGEPKLVESLPVGFHHATLTRDGRVMYLQGPLENERWGLFRSTRPSGTAAWGKPEALASLNHPDGPRGDCSPSLSADGFKLYFASDRPGGKGGRDLYVIDTVLLGRPK